MAQRLRELAAVPAARVVRAVLVAAAPSVLSELDRSLGAEVEIGEDPALKLARSLDVGEQLRGKGSRGRAALALYDAHEEWAVGIEEMEEDQGRDAVQRIVGLAELAARLCGGVPGLERSPAGRALLAWTGLVELALAFTSLGEIQEEHQPQSLMKAYGGQAPEGLLAALEPFVEAGTGAVAEMADALRGLQGDEAGPGVYELLVAVMLGEQAAAQGPVSFAEAAPVEAAELPELPELPEFPELSELPELPEFPELSELSEPPEPPEPIAGPIAGPAPGESELVGEDPEDFWDDEPVDPPAEPGAAALRESTLAALREALAAARQALEQSRAALEQARAETPGPAPDREGLARLRAEQLAALAARRSSMPDPEALRRELSEAEGRVPPPPEDAAPIAGDAGLPQAEARLAELAEARRGLAEALSAGSDRLEAARSELEIVRSELEKCSVSAPIQRALDEARAELEALSAARESLLGELASLQARGGELAATRGALPDPAPLRESLARVAERLRTLAAERPDPEALRLPEPTEEDPVLREYAALSESIPRDEAGLEESVSTRDALAESLGEALQRLSAANQALAELRIAIQMVDAGRVEALSARAAELRRRRAEALDRLEATREELAALQAMREALPQTRAALDRLRASLPDAAEIAASLAAIRAVQGGGEAPLSALHALESDQAEARQAEVEALRALADAEEAASYVVIDEGIQPPLALRSAFDEARQRLMAAEQARGEAEAALSEARDEALRDAERDHQAQIAALKEQIEVRRASLEALELARVDAESARDALVARRVALEESRAALPDAEALRARVAALRQSRPPDPSAALLAAEEALQHSERAAEEAERAIAEIPLFTLPNPPTMDPLLRDQLGWARERLDEAQLAATEAREALSEAEEAALVTASERERLEHALAQARLAFSAAQAEREALDDPGPALAALRARAEALRAEREAVRSVLEMTLQFVSESQAELAEDSAELAATEAALAALSPLEEPERIEPPSTAELSAALAQAAAELEIRRAELSEAQARQAARRAAQAEAEAERKAALSALEGLREALEQAQAGLSEARSLAAEAESERWMLTEALEAIAERRLALDAIRDKPPVEPVSPEQIKALKLELGDALDEAGEAELREIAARAAQDGSQQALSEVSRAIEGAAAASAAVLAARDGVRRDLGLASRLITERQNEIRDLWDDFAEREVEIARERKKAEEEAEFRASAAEATREELTAAQGAYAQTMAALSEARTALVGVSAALQELPRKSFSLLAGRTAASTKVATSRQALGHARELVEELEGKLKALEAGGPATAEAPDPARLSAAASEVSAAEQALRSRRVELNRVRSALEGYRSTLVREQATAEALRAEIARSEQETAQRQAEARAAAERDAQAKLEAEARVAAEREARAKQEAQAKLQAEARAAAEREARAKQEAQAKLQAEARAAAEREVAEREAKRRAAEAHRHAVERAEAAAKLEAARLAKQAEEDAGGWFEDEPSTQIPKPLPPKVILPSTPTIEDDVGGWWDESPSEPVEDEPTEPPAPAAPPPKAPPKAPPLQPVPADSVGRAAPMTLQAASTTFMSVEDRKRLVAQMMAEEDAEEDELPPVGDDQKTTFFARPVKPKGGKGGP